VRSKREIVIGFQPDDRGHDALALGRLFAELMAASPLVVSAFPWPRNLMSHADLELALGVETRDSFAAVRDSLAGLDPETLAVAAPSAAQALGMLAEEDTARLLVVGSSHRGAVGRTLLGSTGESLLHGAPCAVAVAPRGYAQREQKVRRVAVAFDGSSESWAALETALGLTSRLHADLTVVTIADYATYGYATGWSILTAAEFHDHEREEKQRVLDLALKRAPSQVNAEGRMLTGEPGKLLAELSSDFDLMVTGSRGYGPLRRTLLGSTTRRLLAASVCPVLVLPRGISVDPLALGGRPQATAVPEPAVELNPASPG
jgi:nucleotide-binding universal stress UspA family protein